MDTIELIKDACLFGGTIPNKRIKEVRAFLDNAKALQLLQPDVISRFYCQDEQEQEKKAKELYEMFYFATDQDGFHSQNKYRAKVQASLCCNEIIKEYNKVESYNSDWWKGVMQFISDI